MTKITQVKDAGEFAAHSLWPDCGYQYLETLDDSRLIATPEFIAHFFSHPDFVPMPDSCAVERELHGLLKSDPMAVVGESMLANIEDEQTRQGYGLAIAFRDFLSQSRSLEAAYVDLVSGRAPHVTVPLFVDLLVQLILRHLLGDRPDVWRARAAELLFRVQRVSTEQGVIVADAAAQCVRRWALPGALQSLIAQAAIDSESGVECLSESNQNAYWENRGVSELALSLAYKGNGLAALCRVWEQWIEHFHGLQCKIEPVAAMEGEEWGWHIGMDAASNELLNRIYQGQILSDEEMQALLALFTLSVEDASLLQEGLQSKQVYLAIAMGQDQTMRMKPQNLLLNFPLRKPA